MKQLRCKYLFIILYFFTSLHALIDNRFLDPYLLTNGHMQRQGTAYYIGFQPFIMTARTSFGTTDQNHIPLFSFLGNFDQIALNQALFQTGKITQSLIPFDFMDTLALSWNMNGHLEIFGLGLNYYHILSKHISWGFRGGFMHAMSRMEMIFDKSNCTKSTEPTESEIQQLVFSKEAMLNVLDMSPGLWNKTSLTDLDVYLRLGTVTDYKYRFRRIDAGVIIGALFPTASSRNLYNPASIPLGGNKHWGMYTAVTADFGLKEDITAGFFIQVSKRFPKTECIRVPALNENPWLGALVQTVRVDPGVTAGFSAYAIFENLRNGLGFRTAYKIVGHAQDSFGETNQFSTLTFNEGLARRASSWAIEDAMVGIFYDFGHDKEIRGATPTLSLMWDIPVQFLTSRRAFRTHGISLLLETEF